MCYNLFCQFGQSLIWIPDFCHDLNTDKFFQKIWGYVIWKEQILLGLLHMKGEKEIQIHNTVLFVLTLLFIASRI